MIDYQNYRGTLNVSLRLSLYNDRGNIQISLIGRIRGECIMRSRDKQKQREEAANPKANPGGNSRSANAGANTGGPQLTPAAYQRPQPRPAANAQKNELQRIEEIKKQYQALPHRHEWRQLRPSMQVKKVERMLKKDPELMRYYQNTLHANGVTSLHDISPEASLLVIYAIQEQQQYFAKHIVNPQQNRLDPSNINDPRHPSNFLNTATSLALNPALNLLFRQALNGQAETTEQENLIQFTNVLKDNNVFFYTDQTEEQKQANNLTGDEIAANPQPKNAVVWKESDFKEMEALRNTAGAAGKEITEEVGVEYLIKAMKGSGEGGKSFLKEALGFGKEEAEKAASSIMQHLPPGIAG